MKYGLRYIAVLMIIIINDNFAQYENIIMLSNDFVEVGILPEVGGRIVLLRKPGLKNILKSDESLWENPENQKPEVSPFGEFKSFYGHITWVGPQSEWWTHQTLNEERQNEKADWPPDPYLTYGNYEIISQSDTSIKIVGPASPVSGVRLLKEISIKNSGTVTITSTAENIRNENVSWDLWMLTRLDGFAKTYVPIEQNGILELKKSDNETIEATPYKILDRYFTFCASLPAENKIEQVQEVHLYPSDGYIAGFSEKQMLLISFEQLDAGLVHPQHGLVELYNFIDKKGSERLLELEVHGAYKTLASGQKMSLKETWKLFKYNGAEEPSAQIKFLEDNL